MSHLANKKLDYFKDFVFNHQELSFFDRFEKAYMASLEFAKNYPLLVKAGQKVITSSYYQNSKQSKDQKEFTIDYYNKLVKIDQEKKLIRDDIDSLTISKIVYEVMFKVTFDEYFKDELDLSHLDNIIKAMLDVLKKGMKHDV